MTPLACQVVFLVLCSLGPLGPPSQAGVEPPVPTKSAPPTLPADPIFDKRLTALDDLMSKTSDFRAAFRQEKHTPLLKKPIVSEGVMTSKDGFVRWETTKPSPVVCVIEPAPPVPATKPEPTPPPTAPTVSLPPTPTAQPVEVESLGAIRVYYPADGLCEIYPIGGALSDFAGVPLPRIADLRRRFSIERLNPTELGADKSNPALLALLLRPLSADTRKYIETIKVLIDESIPAATKVVVTDADGERTEISLTAIRINTGLKRSDVQLTLPPNVRISRPLAHRAPAPPTPSSPPPVTPWPK